MLRTTLLRLLTRVLRLASGIEVGSFLAAGIAEQLMRSGLTKKDAEQCYAH